MAQVPGKIYIPNQWGNVLRGWGVNQIEYHFDLIRRVKYFGTDQY